MKLLLSILFTIVFQHLNGQNLFLIGNKSYPSTPTFSLKSNAVWPAESKDLGVVIAKNGTSGFIVVSTESMTGVLIKGNLVIYLDGGIVINCLDKGKYDYVDGIATTVYNLTNIELEKLMTSNIYKIRFNLKCGSGCKLSSEEGAFSASNENIKDEIYGYNIQTRANVPELVSELFNN